MRNKLLSMSVKEIIRDLLDRMPEDTSLEEYARQIEFIAGVKQGMVLRIVRPQSMPGNRRSSA